jgi:hypothetical protein
VLLGVGGTWHIWRPMLSALQWHHRVYAPTLPVGLRLTPRAPFPRASNTGACVIFGASARQPCQLISTPPTSSKRPSAISKSAAYCRDCCRAWATFPVNPALVTRDPAKQADYVEDPLNLHGKVPVRTLAEMIDFVTGLRRRLHALPLPLLIQHGSDDQLTGVSGSEMVLDRISSQERKLKVYTGLYHEIYNELSRNRERGSLRIFSTAWLQPRLP